MITSAEEARKAMGSPYGKTVKQLKELAIDHWTEWRPKFVKDLIKQNRLQTVALAAAKKASEEIRELMEYGYQLHEAEEVVLQKYILRPPEPEVIAEMENPER